VQPLRQLGLLALLAAPPVGALIVQQDTRAVRSVLHVAVAFAILLLAFRLLGKRELSRLSPFELVTLMLIPEILSSSLQGEDGLGASLVGLSTVLALVFGVSLISQRFPGVQPVLESSPTVLVLDGKLLEKAMNQERIPPDELVSEMRKQGLERLEEVHLAVLESSGNITFVARDRAPHPSGDDDREL
jgi:uncharacterized membrane protein YcaP (DUF421 family)